MTIQTPIPGYTQTTVLGEHLFPDGVSFGSAGKVGSFSPGSDDLTLWGASAPDATNYAMYAHDDVTTINAPEGKSVHINIGDEVSAAVFTDTGSPSFPGAVGAPASASAPGVAGQFAFTSDFFYACVATNTWVRVALATW